MTGLALAMFTALSLSSLAGYSTAQAATLDSSPTAQERFATWLEARDLPIDQYTKLRAKALSDAGSAFGPRIKNPQLSKGGLAPAVQSLLEDQRRYLHRSGEFGGRPHLSPAAMANHPCLAPLIIAVNGQATHPIFTPRLGDNHYRIEGCGFGDVPGEVHLVGDSSSRDGNQLLQTALQLERPGAWSENQIDVRLDPRIAGVPDSPATLLVRRADGEQIELRDCHFVAVRGAPVVLNTIAASWVNLSVTGEPTRPIPQIEYVSPPASGDDVPHDAAQMSAFVIRSDRDGFGQGADTYDFSVLNDGWVVESVQVESYAPTCPGDVMRTDHSGGWAASFDDRQLIVNWQSDSCSSFIPPMFRFRMAASEYALRVWVTGPIGTEPVRTERAQKD